MSRDWDSLESSTPPMSKLTPFIPIDPYLGHRQHWAAARETLTSLLKGDPNSEAMDAIHGFDQLAEYVAPSKASVRPLLVVSDQISLCSQALARLAGRLRLSREVNLSATFVRHQPRLARLPLLVQTARELTCSLSERIPSPHRSMIFFDGSAPCCNRSRTGQ